VELATSLSNFLGREIATTVHQPSGISEISFIGAVGVKGLGTYPDADEVR
jgi:hypothetical protein